MKKSKTRILLVVLAIFLLLVGIYVYHMSTLREGNFLKRLLRRSGTTNEQYQEFPIGNQAANLEIMRKQELNVNLNEINPLLNKIGVNVPMPELGSREFAKLEREYANLDKSVQDGLKEILGNRENLSNIENWSVNNGKLEYKNPERPDQPPFENEVITKIIDAATGEYESDEDVGDFTDIINEYTGGYLNSDGVPEAELASALADEINRTTDVDGYSVPEAIIAAQEQAARDGYEIPQPIMEEALKGVNSTRVGYSDAVVFVRDNSQYQQAQKAVESNPDKPPEQLYDSILTNPGNQTNLVRDNPDTGQMEFWNNETLTWESGPADIHSIAESGILGE